MLPSGLLLLTIALGWTAPAAAAKFKVIREWRYVNFTWPDAATYSEAIARGLYVPQNVIPTGLRYHGDHYYVATPRLKPGVPATLSKISATYPAVDYAPPFEPFPTWAANKEGDCASLQSVYGLEVEPRGRLWAADSGSNETGCRPKLVVFDVQSGQVLLRHELPEDVAAAGTILYDVVLDLDHRGGGYAYITDSSIADPGIIVYSMREQQSWKIRHSASMRPDPTATTFRVNDYTVNTPTGIAGIALGPRVHTSDDQVVVTEEREVFYAPLSSLHLYSISSTDLRNKSNGQREFQGDVRDYGNKVSQSSGMCMSAGGALYYTLLNSDSVARWDTRTPFNMGQRLLARDRRFLEWPQGMAFTSHGNLTVLVNQFDRFLYGLINVGVPNFRLITSYMGEMGYLQDGAYDREDEGILTTTSTNSMMVNNTSTPSTPTEGSTSTKSTTQTTWSEPSTHNVTTNITKVPINTDDHSENNATSHTTQYPSSATSHTTQYPSSATSHTTQYPSSATSGTNRTHQEHTTSSMDFGEDNGPKSSSSKIIAGVISIALACTIFAV